MTTTSEQLQVLLDNPPYVGETYSYWYGEADEGTAEATAREAMQNWVKKVEAILRAANRREELKIWNDATRPVSANFEDEERNKAVLRSIIDAMGKPAIDSDVQELWDGIKTKVASSIIGEGLKSVSLSDLRQAHMAYGSQAYKACVVMLGSVLEGVMLGALSTVRGLAAIRNDPDLPGNITGKNGIGGVSKPEYAADSHLARALADKLSFDDYRVLVEKYIPGLSKLGVENIQHFRNAVHPSRVLGNPTIYGDFDKTRAITYISSLLKLVEVMVAWCNAPENQ